MTADQPQPPESSTPEPSPEENQTPPELPEPPPAASQDAGEATVRSQPPPDQPPEPAPRPTSRRPDRVGLGEVWAETRPLFKLVTIQALKGTIGALEKVVERLEAEPPPKSSITASSSEPVLQPEATAAPAAPASEPLLNPLQTLWQRAKVVWFGILRQIRSRLPATVNQRFDDRALTATIAFVLVIAFWTTANILSGQPKPTDVATAPELAESPAEVVEVPPELTAPEVQQPIVEQPTPEASPSPQVESSPPPLLLTPEQKLIASIQDQVAEVSDRYVDGLIQSVQANFRSSRLMVTIADSWYGLSRSQQDKLANDLLKRAQELDFIKLELLDPDEALLARSPVVGSEMIILRRSNEPQATAEVERGELNA